MIVAEIARLRGWHVVGFLDQVNPDRAGSLFAGSTVLGGEEQVPNVPSEVRHAIVAIGNCRARLAAAQTLSDYDFDFPVLCHPHSCIATDACIGRGTVVAAGAVICPQATIGEHCILNTLSSVDHECHLESGVHICPGVHLAGNVHVGLGTTVGIGSVVREKIHIGNHVSLGAGSVVVRDIPDGVLAYGVPARVQSLQDKSIPA